MNIGLKEIQRIRYYMSCFVSYGINFIVLDMGQHTYLEFTNMPFNTFFFFFRLNSFFIFGFEETSSLRKAYFMGPGEEVKSQLSLALTKNTRPDSNSRPTVQISTAYYYHSNLNAHLHFIFYIT